jgi:hypothetical protein
MLWAYPNDPLAISIHSLEAPLIINRHHSPSSSMDKVMMALTWLFYFSSYFSFGNESYSKIFDNVL